MRSNSFLNLAVLAGGGSLLLALLGTATPSPEITASLPTGTELFVDKYKCDGCHSVSAAGVQARAKAERLKGPDLSGYRAPVHFPVFAAYLRGEKEIEGKSHRLKFKGSDEELQTILDWLGSLETR